MSWNNLEIPVYVCLSLHLVLVFQNVVLFLVYFDWIGHQQAMKNLKILHFLTGYLPDTTNVLGFLIYIALVEILHCIQQ